MVERHGTRWPTRRSTATLALLSGLCGAQVAGFHPLAAGGLELEPKGSGVLFIDSGQQLGSSDTSAVALGDLDGDGDLDAFAVSESGDERPTVWINQGGEQGGQAGLFAPNGQDFSVVASTDVVLGDLDGDGDLDAFIANEVLLATSCCRRSRTASGWVTSTRPGTSRSPPCFSPTQTCDRWPATLLASGRALSRRPSTARELS
jgi:hypothetical protein